LLGLTQSLAIIDYLEYLQPTPALLPSEPLQRARVLAASQVIACDIHPVNNSKVVAHLRQFDHTADHALQWMHHWMHEGLTAFAALINPAGRYCFGDQLTLADICLIPQLYNAHRWGLELSSLQRLCEIEARCLELQPFRHAHPQAQPDAEN